MANDPLDYAGPATPSSKRGNRSDSIFFGIVGISVTGVGIALFPMLFLSDKLLDDAGVVAILIYLVVMVVALRGLWEGVSDMYRVGRESGAIAGILLNLVALVLGPLMFVITFWRLFLANLAK